MAVELQMITRRRIPQDLVETFDRQTSRRFSMKILTRYPQPWRAEDLDAGFPLRVIPQRLFHASGTRYGLCLARNELLCHAEADHILVLDDYTVISPLAVERLLGFLKPDLVVRGWKRRPKQRWKGPRQYEALFNEHLKGKARGSPKPRVEGSRGDGRGGFIDPKLITGFDLFPTGLLRRVNGWDAKFDGGWGLDDYDLGSRLAHAGARFRRVAGVAAVQLQHPSHLEERDDEPLNGGFIYNRETGARARFSYREHHERQAYYESRRDGGATRAPFGLRETCQLLGRSLNSATAEAPLEELLEMHRRAWNRIHARGYGGYAKQPEERVGLMFSLLPEGFAKSEAVVLEIGCGSGVLIDAVAPRVKEVHGVDLSPEAVRLARERLNRGNAHLHVNDGFTLDLFPSGKFDLVYSYWTFQHIPRRAALSYLKEAGRVLKPGGLMLFQVVSYRDPRRNLGDIGVQKGVGEQIGYGRETLVELVEESGLKLWSISTETEVWSGPRGGRRRLRDRVYHWTLCGRREA